MNIEIEFLENKLNFYEKKYQKYLEKAENKYKYNQQNWSNLKETKLFRTAYTKILELKKQLENLKQTEFIIYIKRHTHHFIKNYTLLSEVFLNGFNEWVLRFYKNGKEYLFFWSEYKKNRKIKIIERN